MPCDGITVMRAQLQQEQLAEVVQILQGLNVKINKGNLGFSTIFASVVIGKVPVRIAIETDGTVTCITDSGTFEQGKEVLQQFLVAALRAQGVRVSNVQLETHSHNKNAPRLAYASPLHGSHVHKH